MTKTYPGLVHLNGNLLAAIDLETTGLQAGYHEPIQIAVVPLNSDLRPLEGVRPFYMAIRPEYPERQDKAGYVHGIKMEDLILHSPDAGKVQDLLVEWWESLDLPVNKTLIPLAHNWAFESKFLQAWMGVELSSMLFHGHARDAMLYALSLNDKAAFMGLPVPFAKVGLASICKHFKIVNPSPHDALSDAIAEAECYRATALNCLSESSPVKPTSDERKPDEIDGLQSSPQTCILEVSGRLAACCPTDARVRPLIYLASGAVHALGVLLLRSSGDVLEVVRGRIVVGDNRGLVAHVERLEPASQRENVDANVDAVSQLDDLLVRFGNPVGARRNQTFVDRIPLAIQLQAAEEASAARVLSELLVGAKLSQTEPSWVEGSWVRSTVVKACKAALHLEG